MDPIAKIHSGVPDYLARNENQETQGKAHLPSDTGFNIEKLYQLGPVTALHSLGDQFLLSSSGPDLHIYHFKLPCQPLNPNPINALGSMRIHGVHSVCVAEKESQKKFCLVVYGGKSVRWINLSLCDSDTPSYELVYTSPIVELKDWVLDLCFQAIQSHSGVAAWELNVAFSHAFVASFSVSTGNGPDPLNQFSIEWRGSSQCPQNCLLYAAKFLSNNLVASGTVFNQVLIWEFKPSQDDRTGVLIHRLVGHEGVIFGLDFDAESSRLLSTSDDRTIRMWQLSPPDLLQPTLAPTCVIYGHLGRVWLARFLSPSSNRIVSVSEDSTCQMWEVLPCTDGPLTASSKRTWATHSGKNIWSFAVNDSRTVLATGGGDGGINLHSLDENERQCITKNHSPISLDLPPFSSYGADSAQIRSKKGQDGLISFILTSFTTIVAGTQLGYLLELSSSGNIEDHRPIYFDQDLAGYSVLAKPPTDPSRNTKLLVVGSKHGHLVFIDMAAPNQAIKIQAYGSRLTHVSIHNGLGKNQFCVFSRGIDNFMQLHHVVFGEAGMEVLGSGISLEIPQNFYMTSFAFEPFKHVAVCGSRRGALLVFDLSRAANSLQAILDFGEPTDLVVVKVSDLVKGVHSLETVTCIEFKNSEVYSAGRDGAYAIHHLKYSHDGSLSLGRVFHSRVTKGWIEQIQIVDGHVLLFLFHRKLLHIHDLTQNTELFEVACGGAHRKWFVILANPTRPNATIAYFRQDQVAMHLITSSADSNIPPKLQMGLHGREIRATSLVNFMGTTLLVTGAEDCSLRLHYKVQEHPGWKPILSVKKHQSAIFSMAWNHDLHSEPILFSAGGGENLLAWRLKYTEELTLPNALSMASLFLQDIAAAPPVCAIPDTRILTICTFTMGTRFVAAGYSDGIVRLWAFESAAFMLVASLNLPHPRCLMAVSSAKFIVNDQEQWFVLGGASNGKLSLWNVTERIQSFLQRKDPSCHQLSPELVVPIHNSAINCIEIIQSTGKEVVVATGGEDTGLGLVTLLKGDSDCVSLGDVSFYPMAHASAIQGMYPHDTASGVYLVTIGLDQRIITWSINLLPLPPGSSQPVTGSRIALHAMAHLDVPDPNNLSGICLPESSK
ncbi:WD repeat-containing protein 6, variant 2 [Entomophthora muscae]|nr:WD repeat-containing protein 6, variant 2 [Entomophthora muscae]